MNFYNRVKNCCEQKKKITLSEMVKTLGLSTGMPTKWKNGLIPNGETLIKISDFLEESTDYLLGRTKPENEIKSKLFMYNGSPKKEELKNKIDSIDLPDEKIDLLLDMIDSWI